MLSIENALGMYSDKLNANEKIDLNYFKEHLSITDYNEFLELIEFVKLSRLVKAPDDFEKKFAELDKIKNQHYAKGVFDE